ncbi:hypothetical protein V8E54_013877 [Elaphomyces granulatus]
MASQLLVDRIVDSPRPQLSEFTVAPSDISSYVNYKIDIERRLEGYSQRGPKDDTVLVLRSFFKFQPQEGQNSLADDILTCQNDAELHDLASHLVEGLLYPLKASTRTPAVITPPPRLGVEDSVENLTSLITESAIREQPKLRRQCLQRDGNRCCITKAYNVGSGHEVNAPLEAAHIIPFSLACFSNDAEHYRLPKIWTNIYRYFPGVRSRLNFGVESINDTKNVMMLVAPLHAEFGSFHLALEPMEAPDTYKIKTFPKFASLYRGFLPADGIVKFTNHDPRYALPSPILLGLHAAIANILHATGRGEAAEKLLHEREEICVLAENGSTNVHGLLAVSGLAQPLALHPFIFSKPPPAPRPLSQHLPDSGSRAPSKTSRRSRPSKSNQD